MMLPELKMNQVHQQQQQQQSMLYNAAGQPVTIAFPPPTTAYELYDSGQSLVAGIILIVVGILSIVVNGVGIGIGEEGTMTGQGIGGGVLVSKLCRYYFFYRTSAFVRECNVRY